MTKPKQFLFDPSRQPVMHLSVIFSFRTHFITQEIAACIAQLFLIHWEQLWILHSATAYLNILGQ